MHKGLAVAATALLLFSNSDVRAEKMANREPVLGRVILADGGTSEHRYIMPVVYKPHGPRKVILGYLDASVWTGEIGISFAKRDDDTLTHFGDLYSLADVQYIMLDCSKKTYTHFPRQANNAAIKQFFNGDAHKWGEYEGWDNTIHYASWGVEEVNQLFEDACAEDRF